MKNVELPPLLPFPGSKRLIAGKIAALLPPHKIYVEPFAGGASVFFAKPLAPKNVLNDLDRNLIRFYRQFRKSGCSKVASCDAAAAPTLQSARQAILHSKSGTANVCEYFAARKLSTLAKSKGVSKTVLSRYAGKSLSSPKNCELYERKLRAAVLENRDFRTVAKKYDSNETVQYWDPPYGKKGFYPFESVTPREVCDAARNLKSKVVISYPDDVPVRRA